MSNKHNRGMIYEESPSLQLGAYTQKMLSKCKVGGEVLYHNEKKTIADFFPTGEGSKIVLIFTDGFSTINTGLKYITFLWTHEQYQALCAEGVR